MPILSPICAALVAVFLQLADSVPPKPAAPPGAWRNLIGAYVADRDTHHLPEQCVLLVASRVPAASRRGGAGAGRAYAAAAWLWPPDPRCLPAVVRDEGLLGRNAGRFALARGGSRQGLQAQPRRGGRHHAVRPKDRGARRDAFHV